jgi:hypothetical protein
MPNVPQFNNRYWYLPKKIFRILFRGNGTISEDTNWIRRYTRVITIYWNIPKELVDESSMNT